MRTCSLRYVPQWYVPRRKRQWLGRSEITVQVYSRRSVLGFHYVPWRGYRLASFALLVADELLPPYYYPHFGEYQVNRRKVKTDDPSASIPSAKVDSKFFRTLPCLLAHCSATQYEDRSARKPGWLTIATWGTGWRVTAKDPDSAAALSVTAPTLDEALTGLEQLLSDAETPWEPDQWLAGRKPRKKRG